MSDDWSTWGSSKLSSNRASSPRNYYGREAIPAAVTHPARAAVTQPQAQQSPHQGANRSSEYVQRFAGVTVQLASVVSEHVLSHPCIVLRRQCQVHNSSQWYHLTPFSLFHVVFNIHRHQSVTTLWKGIGSTLMVKGLEAATETTIHEFTPLPREVTRHSSLKKLVEHLLLKGITLVIITPFCATSVVETVQSEIACERPGVFDCIIEGFGRMVSFTSAQPTRLLPIWKLILPAVVYGLSHYIISSLARYRVAKKMKNDMSLSKAARASESEELEELTPYKTYYPDLVATFTGNLLADTLLYPLETILHRLYLQGTRTIIDNTDTGLEVVPIMTRYDGALDCYSSIMAEEGVSGLYKGFGALLLQYALHVAVLKLTRFGLDLMSSSASNAPAAVTSSEMPSPAAYDSLRASGAGSRFRSDYSSPGHGDYSYQGKQL